MKAVCVFLLSLVCTISQAQNLVPNGDFEQFSGCPSASSQIDSALFWINPSTNMANSGSPDYYHQCVTNNTVGVPQNWVGYQTAHSGVAYAGEYLYITSPSNAREYLEAPLTTPLIAGASYQFEMYVSLGDQCQFTTDDIGVYFSDTLITGINNFAPLPFTSQVNNATGNFLDTLGWVQVSGLYQATGGECHIVIGNFKDDAATTVSSYNPAASFDFIYVLIDDVSLVPESPSHAGNNLTGEDLVFSLLPNPSNGKVQLELSGGMSGEIRVQVFDKAGRQICNMAIFKNASGRRIPLDLAGATSGVYLVRVISENTSSVKRLVVVSQ